MDNDHVLSLIAQRLLELRLKADLNQTDLAKKAGVGVNTVTRYEAQGPSKFAELSLLAEALGMGLHEFLRPVFSEMPPLPRDVREATQLLLAMPPEERGEVVGMVKGVAFARGLGKPPPT
jgi:transcriptional regulator with XRE-family HTH domain